MYKIICSLKSITLSIQIFKNLNDSKFNYKMTSYFSCSKLELKQKIISTQEA